ncbi:putative ribonuclease H-like domain-containing protein [Tanacetum coccineum]|uniref:Ribonuclease H-like domain-containing protein n=1 Tax=Tanacetum coccineum TaxID=301880 RepID=A0ABQ4WJ17_9ASTR
MCDKKNSVLFTKTECLILSLSFKLLDESQVVLRAPKKDNVYSLELKNIIPSRGITCLYANATADEFKLWHRRLGHVNFKNINKLVKGHLVRGLPSKVVVNDQTCVACKKGKQHKASCKAKLERIIRKPLELPYMDLFGPVSVESINKKRCPLTILNTLDSLRKFDGKSDECYLLGYSTTSKTFRVYNKRTKRVEENLHINFLEDQPNVTGTGPNWMFDLDFLTNSMKTIIPVCVVLDNQVNVACRGKRREYWIQKRAAQTTSIAKLNTGRSSVSTATTLYVSAASTPTDASDAFSSDGIFNGAYDDEKNVGAQEGSIGQSLFIKKKKIVKSDIMLVQVYVDDIIFGSTKKSMCTEFEDCMHKRFQMSSMGELTFFLGLQVKQQPDGIFISQDKYVADILKKFDFWSIRTATTPIESNKPLVKDEDGEDVDVHVYRSMIGSLMYLTASRPDIMFAVCACARFQVTPKASHLNAVKRIFRYLKHQPKLGLWYPRDSPFELEAFSDSDYGGASLDRKSTTGGCQFLGRRLISWQCKKQTIVANSTTEAEYVAAANCCGQVLWIQNQMMDYGFNFMNTKIHIDNESTISVIKNPVAHSRTKHIEIRFHFIRDCYEKRLIEVIKIHTDSNVADLLTKGFDVTRFNFLVVSIGMLNL